MKFSEQWLRQWIKLSISSKELCEQLTMLGLEVDEVLQASNEFTKVIIGEVKSVEPHPDADRLSICQVMLDKKNTVQIVCGASNVRAGLKVPVATIGATLNHELTIKEASLKGVQSSGMICSAQELGLAEESTGILELPNDAPVGTDVRSYLELDDAIIDIDLTPNRGDCLSLLGVAREIATRNKTSYNEPPLNKIKSQCENPINVKISAKDGCPRYVGRTIKGINANAPTPIWMKERLRRSGIRCIHPVVDVTNYVMMELGQPMHGFDLDVIEGDIDVRFAKKNEALILLDGQTISLKPETLVIADSKKVLAMAGVMGGHASGVTTLTKDIFLESAFFDPLTVAKQARGYGIYSDSSHRFERGVDPHLQVRAIERATELLLEIVGGEAAPLIHVYSESSLPSSNTIILRSERIQRVLGLTLDDVTVETTLQSLGFDISQEGQTWKVVAPSHRFDMNLEEDLIEEVARMYGYDQIERQQPTIPCENLSHSFELKQLHKARQILTHRGYREVVTYSFVDPQLQTLFDSNREALALKNPISIDLSVMRTTLWPSLIKAVTYNQNRQQQRIRLFETGLRFKPEKNELIQEKVLSGMACGDLYPLQWSEKNHSMDFYDLKADLEILLQLTNQTGRFQFVKTNDPALHPGQAAQIEYDGKVIGSCGALHPRIIQTLDMKGPIFVFELTTSIFSKQMPTEYQPISKFPFNYRDLSFVVDDTIEYGEIIAKIWESEPKLLKNVEIFDVYRGKGLESNKQSIALRLTLQDASKTLVDEEINESIAKIILGLKHRFNVSLRE